VAHAGTDVPDRPARDPAIRPGGARRRRLCARHAALSAGVLLAGCASWQPAPAGARVERLELLALLQTLNADLLSHSSATLTLERWCADHHMADPARVVAQRVHEAAKPLPDELRMQLGVAPGEPVGYRHVRLACGDHVLSDADNWYVPGRLTAEMNRRLDTTDEPFGKVVAPLRFQRRTVSAQLQWSPLPAGWEMRPAGSAAASAAGPPVIPRHVLRHEAILYTAEQVPISAVVETYTDQVFAFGEWPARFGDR
jgi:chorismate-pyruvate lyase